MPVLRYDVVVNGAGPAGSIAARALARAGLKVALLDRAVFPRSKICGNCLDPRCWEIWRAEELDDSFRKLPHSDADAFELAANGIRLREPLQPGAPPHRMVAREVLDEWLRTRAVEAGVDFYGDTRPSAFSAPAEITAGDKIFSADFVIGADGRNSWISRAAGLARDGFRRCRRIGWHTAVPADAASGGVAMRFIPEGYFGLARYHHNSANFCMVIRSHSSATPQQILQRLLPGVPAGAWRSTSPIDRRCAKAAAGRVLLAGDAARVVEPFTGEGIYFALRSGLLAADCILRGLDGDAADQVAAIYRKRHRAIYRELSWYNRPIAWLGRHPRTARRVIRLLAYRPAILRLFIKTQLIPATDEPM